MLVAYGSEYRRPGVVMLYGLLLYGNRNSPLCSESCGFNSLIFGLLILSFERLPLLDRMKFFGRPLSRACTFWVAGLLPPLAFVSVLPGLPLRTLMKPPVCPLFEFSSSCWCGLSVYFSVFWRKELVLAARDTAFVRGRRRAPCVLTECFFVDRLRGKLDA